MSEFTPVSAIVGGALIGLAAVLMMLSNGRITGISSITAGLLTPPAPEHLWRGAFILGLITAPWLYLLAGGILPRITVSASDPVLVVAGLIVGFGTRLGGGCTSGHGVCGLARFSARSVAATLCFILTGMLSVFMVRHGGLG